MLFMAMLFYIGLAGGGVGSTSMGIGLDGGSDWARSATLGWLAALALVATGLAHPGRALSLAAHVGRAGRRRRAGRRARPDPVGSRPPSRRRISARAGARAAAPGEDRGGRRTSPAGGSQPGLPRGTSCLAGPAARRVGGRSSSIGCASSSTGATSRSNGLQQCCLGRPARSAPRRRTPATPPSDGRAGRTRSPWCARLAVPDLRAKPVTLDAEATVVFMRHRLAASIPLSPGAAFRGDGYVVEVLGGRTPVAVGTRPRRSCASPCFRASITAAVRSCRSSRPIRRGRSSTARRRPTPSSRSRRGRPSLRVGAGAPLGGALPQHRAARARTSAPTRACSSSSRGRRRGSARASGTAARPRPVDAEPTWPSAAAAHRCPVE